MDHGGRSQLGRVSKGSENLLRNHFFLLAHQVKSYNATDNTNNDHTSNNDNNNNT